MRFKVQLQFLFNLKPFAKTVVLEGKFMRTVIGFIALFFLIFSTAYGENYEKQLPAKPSEQKEINAAKHLEKEMQQKQLSSKPELLTEPRANKEEFHKKSSGQLNKKHKYSKNNQVKKRGNNYRN
ncbi:MAG: hypothetical protein JWQ09_1412 [Segetibacter sp.]|nr:hypothetical protein [Segetibacter sp.]